MFCPYCGSTAGGVGGRCGTCGRSLADTHVAVQTAPANPAFMSEPTTTRPLTPGQAFGTRYRVLKVLGAGGMGVVYQAWDQTLDVPVALKVIRPEVLTDPAAADEVERRFKRELLLARQVTHRNVVRIHDIGEVDGIKYISMPFIEGRDLATVLAESGRLPVTSTIAIIKQVAEGLQAAHDAGVVHRDLKPENVMIDAEGRPVIMDFGISRPVSTAGTTMGLTMAGAVVGTLEYMAPEQALAQPIDQRADIYALGLIAYDMLAGPQRLATATTPITEMMQRLQQAPPPLRTKVADIPEPVETMVARALEPDPAKRYQHARDWLADIEAFERGADLTAGGARRRQVPLVAVAALMLILIGIAGGAWYVWPREATAVVQREPVSVLIADFENQTGEDVFDGSLEQALGIGLEGASFVTTFPRREALRAAAEIRPGARLDREVASLVSRREGIKYLLTGAISRDGDGYRISVRAVDPISLSGSTPREAQATNKTDVLAAMNELADGIRTDLGDSPTESSRAAARETFTAGTLQAAAFYSKAQDLAYAGRDEEAIELYKRAVAADEDFGRAYSGWANVAFRLGRLQEANEIYQTKAIPLTARMTDREKYRTLGSYYLQIKGDYAKAIENYSLLVRNYPADGAAHNNLAIAYFNVRDFDKALEEGKRLIDIYPKVVLYRYNYALYAMYAGRFDIAEGEARYALALNPQTAKAYLALAMAALARGDHAAALQAYENAARAGARGESLRFAGLGDLAIAEGRFADAVTILRAGIASDTAGKNVAGAAAKSVALAQALRAAGRPSEALEAARAALAWSTSPSVAVPAAELLIATNHAPEALKLAQALSESLQPTERAAAKIVEGDAAVARSRWAEAITAYREALKLDDLWITRFKLGRAYVLAPQSDTAAYALSELEAECQRRQGESTAVFLDDVPSWRYSVELRYWLGRAYDKAGSPEKARVLYEAYLKTRATATDSLTADARARVDAVAISGT